MGYFVLVIMIACAVFYYRVGELEYDGGLPFAALSVGVWLASAYLLGLGWVSCLLMQAGLFVALTFWNMARKRN